MTGLVLIVQHINEFLTMFGVIILTQIVNMEFIQTNKKSELLVFEGYGYIRHRQLTDGASSWRCCITKCNGRVRLRNDQIEVITAHSHLPDPADIEKRKFRSALKDRAAMADETPRQTIFAAQKDINRETAANIPAYHSNQRTVNRTRQQNRPQMSEPSSLRGFEIPELLQMAHSGEKFMYYDSGPQDEKRIIVFATLPAIDLLEQSEDWFCDGTFSTAPNVFFQVYTIHALVDGVNLPLVYALLPDKKEESYRKLLCSLPETSTKRVTIDFEIAVRNAFLQWNENIQIQFCFFHLGQNVWRLHCPN